MTAKVGFVFECGPDGPDYQVCKHFLNRLNPQVEMDPVFMDNAGKLRAECGPPTAALLETCERVVIVWDLTPPQRKPCRRNQKEEIWASLDKEGVPHNKVALVCVERELESWLIADDRAVEAVLGRMKHPHKVGKITKRRNPDRVPNPKTALMKTFQDELGTRRSYVDHDHARKIAEAVPDFQRIRRSDSFTRFAAKAAGITL